jgi:transcriptional regulator with GAF, ATPase, and Fis domain/SAM-dependent methyltransferase
MEAFLDPVAPPVRLLEVGCGTGVPTAHVAEALKARWGSGYLQVALDQNEADLRAGRVRALPVHPEVGWVVGDAYRLPLPEASVDLILLLNVIRYLRLADFGPEAARVLRPRGRVLVYNRAPELNLPFFSVVMQRVQVAALGTARGDRRAAVEPQQGDPPNSVTTPLTDNIEDRLIDRQEPAGSEAGRFSSAGPGSSRDGEDGRTSSLLTELADTLQHAGRPEFSLHRALSLVASALGAMRATLVVQTGTDVSVLAAVDHTGAEASASALPPDRLVLEQGQPLQTTVAGTAGPAYLGVPLRCEQRVVGALSVQGPGRRWGAQHLRLLGNLSVPITLFIGLSGLLQRERRWPPPDTPTPTKPALLTRSPSMLEVLDTVDMVSGYNVPVLIEGETGTGKELVAHAIHHRSPRATRPFVAVDCASLGAELFESEVFGHRKGSFTGASQDRVGLARAAHGGTLFLDELGELPLTSQAKILRFLETGEVRPLGADRTLAVDCRVLAATNHDLCSQVERGQFRRDLFFRLAVVRVRLPPLRERPDDIEFLAEAFLEEYASRYHKGPLRFEGEALVKLRRHHWQGNVRELRHLVQQIVVCHQGASDTVPCSTIPGDAKALAAGAGGRLHHATEAFRRKMVEEALRLHRNRIGAAAGWLGLTPRGLRKLIAATSR